MKSADLCQQLQQITESPWKQYELNPSKLGRRLREYEIKTRHSDDKSERGYHLTDFAEAFTRYLPPAEKASEGVQGVQQAVDQPEQWDMFGEPKVSQDIVQGVPDSMESAKASQQNSSSDRVSDTLDAMGHLQGDAGGAPTPAAMPRCLTSTWTAPKRERERTRGKHRCPDCQRAPARTDTGLCDFCTAKSKAASA